MHLRRRRAFVFVEQLPQLLDVERFSGRQQRGLDDVLQVA
jgi:hypothetical protein